MAYDKTTHTEVQLDHYGNCPNCGTSWNAGDIFDSFRQQAIYINKTDAELKELVEKYYAPPYKFSRLVGVEYAHNHPQHYDGVSEWQCPDCQYSWYRFQPRPTKTSAT
jgi:rubredoxin